LTEREVAQVAPSTIGQEIVEEIESSATDKSEIDGEGIDQSLNSLEENSIDDNEETEGNL